MKQKKSRRKPAENAESTRSSPVDSIAASASAPSFASSAPLPSTGTRTWLSIWICFHLAALFISFTSVVEPSSIHARLSSLLQPYLMIGHFAADDRPVYLAHGNESEQSHRLQITSDRLFEIEQVDACNWASVGSGGYEIAESAPGLAVSDRVARWLATAATLAENEQPGVVAELLLPIARHFPDATAIRIVRFPTDLSDVNAKATSPYVARIVRTDDFVSLVKLNPKRLSSQAVPTAKGVQE